MAGGSQQQTVFRGVPTFFDKDVSSNKKQPLCADPEGWGPMSSIRYDFTPCFIDVWIVSVAAWGIVAGAGALWLLLKRRSPQPVPKSWHFYVKLVGGPKTNLVPTSLSSQ